MIPVARRDGLIAGGPSGFFRSRARRILPPFYAALVLSLLLNFVAHKLGFYGGSRLTKTGLLLNILLLQDVFHSSSQQVSVPFWSVAMEWKIYFLFPLLIATLRRYGVWGASVLAAVIGYGVTGIAHILQPHWDLDQYSHGCWYYTLLFALGMAAAWGLFSPKGEAVIGVLIRCALPAAIALTVVLWLFPMHSGDWTTYNRHLSLIDPIAGLFTASCLVLIHRHMAPLRRLLSWHPLTLTGTFGYSLYLTHYALLGVVMGLLHYAQRHIHALAHIPGVITLLLAVALCWAFALFFFLIFERPFMSRRAPQTETEVEKAAIGSPAF